MILYPQLEYFIYSEAKLRLCGYEMVLQVSEAIWSEFLFEGCGRAFARQEVRYLKSKKRLQGHEFALVSTLPKQESK